MTWHLVTDHPVAVDSPDHIHPVGTRYDNSINTNWNKKLRKALKPPVKVLDFGCAGGGMVKSLIDEDQIAVGLEGSDWSLIHSRAAWKDIPDNLFTCDVTKPFLLHDGSCEPYQFDVVTMWEFIEHIAEKDLPAVIYNVKLHLKKGGLVFVSTNMAKSVRDGVEHHQTLQPLEWWVNLFVKKGFERRPDLEKYFGHDLVRRGNFTFIMARKLDRQ